MTRILETSADTPLCWSSVSFRAGSACDPVGFEGLAHHAYELARRGAGTRTRAEIDDHLDALGASVYVGAGRDAVTFSSVCLSRHLREVWTVLCDVVAAPSMSDDEHEQLLRETRRDLDSIRDDDASVASRFFARHCLPGYAYARTAIGTDASLDAIDADRARAEIARGATRGGAIFGFAGDLDDATSRELSAQLLDRLPDEPEPAQPDLELPSATPGRHLIIVDKPERTQSQVLIGHVGPRWGGDDSIALLPVDAAFGGMFTSRLMQTIRVEHGWSYGAGCRTYRARGPHWFRISLAPAVDVTPDAVRCALDMYAALCSDGISADELEFARGYLIGGMPFGRATARQRVRKRIRDRICELPPGFDAGLAERLRKITLADTRQAIDRCLSSADLCAVVVCTADRLRAQLETLDWASVTVEDYESY